MSQDIEIIGEFEVLFALRTGVTVMMPCARVFGGDQAAEFFLDPDGSGNLRIVTPAGQAVLQGLRKDYLEEVLSRGTLMVYELKDEEVVRCTPCRLKGK